MSSRILDNLFASDDTLRALKSYIRECAGHEAVCLTTEDESGFRFWRANRNAAEKELSALVRGGK